MTEKKKRLRWKLDPQETGLRSIGAGPRGSTYHDGETEYACVASLDNGWSAPAKGWYWVAYAGKGVPYKNTCNEPVDTEEEAKKQAQEYVKKHLKQENT